MASPLAPAFGAMSDYCVMPPFVAQSISPNILIVFDNSLSMCDQAYSGSYDPSQFANGLYYGYFDGTKNYQYTNNGRWEVTLAAMNTGTVANPIANGSFLNWAYMRRIEVAKKLLVGGKGNPRSPSPGITVKLVGQTDCNFISAFDKDHDTSAGNLIYPFVGDYNFENDDGELNVTSLSGSSAIYTVRPNADISVPAGWSEFTSSGSVTAWDKVDESSADNDSTYIQNNNTTNPVIMDFSYTQAEPAGSITVKLYVRARKSTNSNTTRRINGVLRVNGTNYESARWDIPKSYGTNSWTWATNPQTGAAWTWSEIKQVAASGNLDGFGVKAYDNYSSNPLVRITQVYLTVEVTTPEGGPYSLIVDQGMVKAEGIIDNLDDEVRFGLAYYAGSNDGGKIDTYVGYNSPVNMITSIENLTPSTYTPLGETLYEMMRYFRQENPYYGNSPADYSVGSGAITATNIFRDPYAYEFTDLDASLTDQYVPCAKSFILFLTDGESTFDQSMPGTSTSPPYAPCTLTNIKACSGYGGAPNNPNPRFAGTSVGTTYALSGTDYMIDAAYWGRTSDMRPGAEIDIPTSWRQSLPGTQNVFTYPVFMFGSGSSLLKDTAIYGGFVDKNGNNKPDCNTLPAECYKDSDGDGVVEANGDDHPLTYYEGNDGYALEQSIKTAIYDIIKRAASGTAVSVLSSSEGSGANLMQALFYPKRSFPDGTDISWTSDLMNYWYYLDPYFTSSQIREDTIREDPAYTLLDLTQDYITSFAYDSSQNKTLAHRWFDTTGTGTLSTDLGTVPIEDTIPIWRAGFNLWWTDPAVRNIYTSLNGSTLTSFDTANRATLDDYLGLTASAIAANKTINFVRGYDCADTLTGAACVCGAVNCEQIGNNRTVTAGVCSARRSPCSTAADCPSTETCLQETHVWKLGDIISSTPRIMGPASLNNFNGPSPFGYNDQTYKDFIKSDDYKDRQLVFVGANDGMLHAFRLGKLLQSWTGKHWYEVAKQEGPTGAGGIGSEAYTFIPRNVLPYLQYLQEDDYCHIYMVDGPVTITDASINKPSTCTLTDYWDCPKLTTTMQKVCSTTTATSCTVDADCPVSETCADSKVDFGKTSWRATMIGSMGIGGATSSTSDSDRVITPLSVSGNPLGWSSYFALDVTDQATPQLLWEFSNADLGVSNIGPSIIKVAKKQCRISNAECTTNSDCVPFETNGECAMVKRCEISNDECLTDIDCGITATNGHCVEENGRWFAIMASGATGPITAREFMGTSDKNLRLFVLDLKTGALLRTIDTGITNAFAGSISTSAIDLEKDRPSASGNYQDDAVYIGYVKDSTSGGVLRLVINDDLNPAHWTVSKVIENIGPVTTSVVNLIDRRDQKLWLYFAEGRYFYKQDDLNTRRKLFGIQEPCFNAISNSISTTCTSSLTLINLKDQTTSPTDLLAAEKGWYINMEAAASPNSAERVISNPTPDPLGAVYFLSFAPTSDICSFGGTTYLWAVDYKTGGRVNFVMQGKALIQVSTGEIKELSLSSALTESEGRKSPGFKGIPPTGQGLMVVTNPAAIKKFMHVQEQ